jgi:hypothetical protein
MVGRGAVVFGVAGMPVSDRAAHQGHEQLFAEDRHVVRRLDADAGLSSPRGDNRDPDLVSDDDPLVDFSAYLPDTPGEDGRSSIGT